jgi:hypothetical protein
MKTWYFYNEISGADPYCIISCEGQKVTTNVQTDTCNPEWKQGAIFFRKNPLKNPIKVQVCILQCFHWVWKFYVMMRVIIFFQDFCTILWKSGSISCMQDIRSLAHSYFCRTVILINYAKWPKIENWNYGIKNWFWFCSKIVFFIIFCITFWLQISYWCFF